MRKLTVNRLWSVGIVLAVLLLTLSVVSAQDQPSTVTDDQVNAIAHKLYCPVCENITLDTCGTAACADWRAEIRLMLEQGMDEQAITDDFVRRFGDRVVGTPQDPTLRGISLLTPVLLIGAGLLAAFGLFLGWRRSNRRTAAASAASTSDSPYRDMLEKDLAG
ncbi:MAG: cytochrome c-type biogenesis protein CcmH [Anaerolineae bacterium]|nr:cytochrome c-type biogenesis protein CcmH [Anaerolineae bacterium]